jgi:geranylgeranyl pyrophosphate synthase
VKVAAPRRPGDGLPEGPLRRVEDRLGVAVAAARGVAADAGAQTLAAGGKRLRPVLALLSAPAERRDDDDVAAAAAAVELVHMASLVHDDVLDAAPLRRGARTVWATRGSGIATAAGDYLYARAFAELASTGDPIAVRILASACVDLARGESMQVAQTRRTDTSIEASVERCRLKTGRLFAAACALGARLGGLDDADVAAVERFGADLGLAFQLADDALDCDGDPTRTGKVLGTDLLDGTMTVPLILAARRDHEVAGAIERGIRAPDVLPILARVADTGAVTETRARAVEFGEFAERELAACSGGVDVSALRQVLDRAVARDA